ncbi:MAG: hypothetical protein JW874_14230 [Spirochaetales bacterium]|nr:hypothetical protein [Spirochaetales bacterium]
MKNLILCFVLAVLFVSCSNIHITKPEGFAETKSGKIYRAVSPEGMIFRVRSFKNYPEQDLDFWKQALKAQLVREGYQFIAEKLPDAEREDLVCFEWGAPYGGADYVYLTAVMVKGKKIMAVEATGELKLFRKYEDALIASIKSLE